MSKLGTFFLSVWLLACCQNTSAQPSECMSCRAMSRFGGCPETALTDPPRDRIGFSGTVVAVKDLECRIQIRVNVTRSSTPALPSTIDIELDPCMLGTVGPSITGIVSATPAPTGVYAARPDYECLSTK
jgi:hypothetical protein